MPQFLNGFSFHGIYDNLFVSIADVNKNMNVNQMFDVKW